MSDENTGGTLTYDMVKTLKAQGTKLTVAQCDEAMATVEGKIKALAADLATAAIETGKSSGKVHATTKSPFPVDEDAASAAEGEGKKALAIFGEIGDEIRHLSKLVSWRERISMGLGD